MFASGEDPQLDELLDRPRGVEAERSGVGRSRCASAGAEGHNPSGAEAEVSGAEAVAGGIGSVEAEAELREA